MSFAVELRLLACEGCGAPVDVPDAGGTVTCAYCEAQMAVRRRPATKTAVLEKPELAGLSGPEREAKRLEILRQQAEAPNSQRLYEMLDAPTGLEHLELAHDDPTLPGMLNRSFQRELERCRETPGDLAAEKRLVWMAKKAHNSFSLLGDVRRAHAYVESARECVEDPGFQHLLACEQASLVRREGDLDAALRVLEGCDAEPTLLGLDSAYRLARAMIHLERREAAAALDAVGEFHETLPWSPEAPYQACMIRCSALESLGRSDDAESAFEFNRRRLDPALIDDWLDGSDALAPVRDVFERVREASKGSHAPDETDTWDSPEPGARTPDPKLDLALSKLEAVSSLVPETRSGAPVIVAVVGLVIAVLAAVATYLAMT